MATRHNRASRIKTKPKGARLLTPEEVATRLSVAVQTLAHWRVRGTGPCFIHLSSRCVRYSEENLASWLAQREQDSTAENPIE